MAPLPCSPPRRSAEVRMCPGPPALASPPSREKTALEETVEELRGRQPRPTLRNRPWRPGTQSCRGASGSARSRRRRWSGRASAAGGRWRAGGPPAGISAPRPRVPPPPGPASSGGASETADPLTLTTTHRLHTPPQVQPVPDPLPRANPPQSLGPRWGGPQHGCPLLAQAVTQVRVATPGLQGTRAPPGPWALGAASGGHPDCGPHEVARLSS